MQNKLIKTAIVLTIICGLSFLNSCDLDETPLTYRPEYQRIPMENLLFEDYDASQPPNFFANIMESSTSDSSYTMDLRGFFPKFSDDQLCDDVGTIHFANFLLSKTKSQNIYRLVKTYKTGELPLLINEKVVYTIDSSASFFNPQFTYSGYFPKPLDLKCNFKKNDSILRTDTLSFTWTPDPYFHGKTAIIVELLNPPIFNPEAFTFPPWHKYLNDADGKIIVYPFTYVQMMPPTQRVKVSIARGTETYAESFMQRYLIRTLSRSEYEFTIKRGY